MKYGSRGAPLEALYHMKIHSSQLDASYTPNMASTGEMELSHELLYNALYTSLKTAATFITRNLS